MGEYPTFAPRAKRVGGAVSETASCSSEEVTAAMEAAGVDALWRSGVVEEMQGFGEQAVTEIYLAMLRASHE